MHGIQKDQGCSRDLNVRLLLTWVAIVGEGIGCSNPGCALHRSDRDDLEHDGYQPQLQRKLALQRHHHGGRQHCARRRTKADGLLPQCAGDEGRHYQSTRPMLAIDMKTWFSFPSYEIEIIDTCMDRSLRVQLRVDDIRIRTQLKGYKLSHHHISIEN